MTTQREQRRLQLGLVGGSHKSLSDDSNYGHREKSLKEALLFAEVVFILIPTSIRIFTMTSNRPIVKVAAVQAAPVSFDLDKSLQKLSKLTEEAAAAGADLVVFPCVNSIGTSLLRLRLTKHREAFLSAYPWRYSFDTTIGAREPRGR